MHTLKTTHSFLARRMFYPLCFSSALACAICAGRIYLSGTWAFTFLVWNLFLAWVPYICSLWAARIHERHPRAWWLLLLPAALWLLFFPNAPYIMTDFVHLPRMGFIWWYDVAFLASFAWTGCFLAVASLYIMQSLVTAFVGRVASWLFVVGSIFLSGFGVYMGRFLRWNSWDLLLEPRGVLGDVVRLLRDPLANPRMLGVTIVFALLLLLCYVTLLSGWRTPDASRRASLRYKEGER